MHERSSKMPAKRVSNITPIEPGFWPGLKMPLRVAHDQLTLSLHCRAMCDYAARRGWTVTIDVKEVGSGVSIRELRQKLLDAARRRDIDVVVVWRLYRWGRSMADLWHYGNIGAGMFMNPVRKALLIGIGGTLTYYFLLALLLSAQDGPDWSAHVFRYQLINFLGEVLLIPLIPGAIPGVVTLGVLNYLAITNIGFGVHDGGLIVGGATSAPFVNSWFAYLWLKRCSRTPAFR